MVRFEDVEEQSGEIQKAVVNEKKKDNYYQVTGLPSKMKFYPEGTVIEARPLKVLDVKLLSSLNDKNFNSIINTILSRTIRGINVGNILVADKYYIIFWLRANTYKDSSYTMKFDCPKCDTHAEYNFGLDCLNINELDESFDFSKEFTLPQSGAKLLFKLPSVEEEGRLEDFLGKNTDGIYKDLDRDVLAVSNVVTSVNGEKLSLLQKYEFLSDLFPGDYALVESYIEAFDIGIDGEMSVKCNNCGGISPLGITFQKEFFLPKFDFKRNS